MTEAPASPTRWVVFAVGNVSRGDDALGPLLLARIEAAGLPGVRCIEDFQLQIEHALELAGAEAALFIDAALPGSQPAQAGFHLAPLTPDSGHTPFTHALAPAAVLATYRQIEGRAPPPAWVLAIEGEHFDLGQPPSAAGTRHLAAAWEEVVRLLRSPPPPQPR